MSDTLIRTEYRASNFLKYTIKNFYMLIVRWHRNWTTRKHLAAISDYMLDDIGITGEQARAEVEKPFWRE